MYLSSFLQQYGVWTTPSQCPEKLGNGCFYKCELPAAFHWSRKCRFISWIFQQPNFEFAEMGIELGGDEMLAAPLKSPSLKPLSTAEARSRHQRSKSFPSKRVDNDDLTGSSHAFLQLKLDVEKVQNKINVKKGESPSPGLQTSLQKEILHLERHLQDQFTVRRALEKALGYRSSSHLVSSENSMPRPAKDLIKEIAVLELEVMYLEQYLLSLYRKAFDQQVLASSPSTVDDRLKTSSKGLVRPDATSKGEIQGGHSSRVLFPQTPLVSLKKETGDIRGTENLIDSSVQRSHSSLSHRGVGPARTFPPDENLDKTLRSCHSQPLSFLQYVQNGTANIISLAEHLGTRISDHVPETPNRLSEDVIRSMAAIYCKLADPPLAHHGHSSSPASSLSSTSELSPQDQGDMWSPCCKKESSCDVQLENPSQAEGFRDFSGPYSSMVEVPGICRDGQRLNDVDDMLQNFKSLVQRLENVEPRKLKHEEKIAFWINIHNTLVMHAYLAYGVPQNSIKRSSLLVKAAYNIGGQTINADKIQTSILGCRTSRPGQWLRTFFFPRMKLRGDDMQSYAIDHSEPLLHFALCTGSHSDPPVRIYTAKRVFQELDAAKEEYIKATVNIHKEQKILLPKIVESFAKDSNLSSAEVMDMVQHYLPGTLQKAMLRSQKEKPRKSVEWVPHNFAFRYLLSKELAK
ncbi:hypothetical protein H6P81_021025 [Aristolochia fimbriata]|uniref:Electron transporter n=1 Tax=Aristolochia fimbriata TaxID=158543 RepID=A0AAV7DXU8_ARIFI|nr:hypothetical protein H6P81_021025 [Aristolochia fimbriata]